MLFGGAHWCVNGGFHSAISSYNIGANTYNGSAAHPGSVANGVAATTLNPLTGDVYNLQNLVLRRWNHSSNSVTTLSPSGSGAAGDETMSATDTARGRILYIGGNNDDHHFYNIGSNAWSTATLNGANAGNIAAAGAGALVYVDVLDRFLVRLGGLGGTVYQINPSTLEVTTYPTTGGSSIPATQNGPYNKFLYVPRLGGMIYVPSYSGNVWFMRIR